MLRICRFPQNHTTWVFFLQRSVSIQLITKFRSSWRTCLCIEWHRQGACLMMKQSISRQRLLEARWAIIFWAKKGAHCSIVILRVLWIMSHGPSQRRLWWRVIGVFGPRFNLISRRIDFFFRVCPTAILLSAARIAPKPNFCESLRVSSGGTHGQRRRATTGGLVHSWFLWSCWVLMDLLMSTLRLLM